MFFRSKTLQRVRVFLANRNRLVHPARCPTKVMRLLCSLSSNSHSRTLKVVNTSTQRSRTLSFRALNINKATLRLKQDPSTASSDLTKMEEEVTVISRPNITSLAGMVEGEASTENQSTIRKNSRSRSHTWMRSVMSTSNFRKSCSRLKRNSSPDYLKTTRSNS